MNQQLCLQVLVYVKRMKIISLICLVIQVPNSAGASASLILYLFTHAFICSNFRFVFEGIDEGSLDSALDRALAHYRQSMFSLS